MDNDNGEAEEDTQGSRKGTEKGKGTMDGKGKGKGKGMRNGKEKGIVIQTPAGDNITRAVEFLVQKDMYGADSDMEGKPERIYSAPEALPTISNALYEDTDSSESDGKYALEVDPDVDIRI